MPDSPMLDDVPISADVADVADLLLGATKGSDHITRDALRAKWKQSAPDLCRSRRGSAENAARRAARGGDERRNRGTLASHTLKNALQRLEQLGAARRIGEAPQDAVVVLDRELLHRVARLWDDDVPA